MLMFNLILVSLWKQNNASCIYSFTEQLMGFLWNIKKANFVDYSEKTIGRASLCKKSLWKWNRDSCFKEELTT